MGDWVLIMVIYEDDIHNNINNHSNSLIYRFIFSLAVSMGQV